MFTRWWRTTALASALLVPAGAHAQFLSGSNISGCGGNTFLSCVIFSAAVSGNQLTVNVTNTSGNATANNPGSIFTLIGFGNLSGSLVPTSMSMTGSGSFVLDSHITGFNGYGNVAWGNSATTFGGDASAPAPQNGLKAGQSASFTFTFANGVTAQQIANEFANAQLAIHDQGANVCGNSSKAVFGVSGTTATYVGQSVTCTPPPPPTTVPEPSSLALLGTGIVGLVPIVRRKYRA